MLHRRRIRLVDLSNNNAGPIDFARVKRAGVFGVLLKVSEGTSFVDETFRDRAKAARAAGLHVGGYHFARPDRDALRQADHFVRALGKIERRDLHPALDLETNDGGLSPAALHSWARSFEEHVHSLSGARAILYTYPAFLKAQGWSTRLGSGAGLWIADYGPNDGADHGVPAGACEPWPRPVAHQYTSEGELAGVPGKCDLSHARSRRGMLARGLRGLV